MNCVVVSAFRLRSASFGGRGRSLSHRGQVDPHPNGRHTPPPGLAFGEPDDKAPAGYPVGRGFSIPLQASLEYWVARSSRATTAEGVAFNEVQSIQFQTANDSSVRGSSFRDGALAPDPESRDSGLDASHRPGMTGHDSAFPRREAPEVLQEPFAQEIRGRRECRVLDAPAASRAIVK
jgi:hypothetical protein